MFFDIDIEWGVCREAGRVVNLNQEWLQFLIQHDVESKNLKADILLKWSANTIAAC